MALKASRPCEVISFFPADMSPDDNGSLMIYLALDSFSEFLFQLGTSKEDNHTNLLNAIGQLMKHQDFNLYTHPFTLVLHKYEDLRPQIEEIIKPRGGALIVNDSYVNQKMTPILKMMFEHLSRKM